MEITHAYHSNKVNLGLHVYPPFLFAEIASLLGAANKLHKDSSLFNEKVMSEKLLGDKKYC